MRAWTINNVELSDLDVDTIVFNIQNQDEDYADIRLPRNFDAALPDMFQVGATVVIRHGSTIVFQGEVDNPNIYASDSLEQHSVFVFGPWHRFKQMMFLYYYPYTAGNALSTHGVLGGDVNSLLTTILQQNCSSFITVGHIWVGAVSIPTTDVYDQTMAQVVQSILRYITDAHVIFDYTTTPPTCHILSRASSWLLNTAVDATDGLCDEVSLTPRYDRLINGVKLQYEATGENRSGHLEKYQPGYGEDINTISSPKHVSSSFFICATDWAGSQNDRRVFRRTLKASGAADVTTYVLHAQANQGWSLNNLRYPNWSNFYPAGGAIRWRQETKYWVSFFCAFHTGLTNFDFDLRTTATVSGQPLRPGFGSISNFGYTNDSYAVPLMRVGRAYSGRDSDPNWSSAPVATVDPSVHFGSTDTGSFFSFWGLRGYLVDRISWSFTSAQGCIHSSGSANMDNILFVDRRDLTEASYGRFSHTKTIDNNSIEAPTMGIAAKLLAANSTLVYDGSLSLLLVDDPLRFFGRNRLITVDPVGHQTTLQRFTLDTATGIARLTLGTPEHLGPQDLIALSRAGTA